MAFQYPRRRPFTLEEPGAFLNDTVMGMPTPTPQRPRRPRPPQRAVGPSPVAPESATRGFGELLYGPASMQFDPGYHTAPQTEATPPTPSPATPPAGGEVKPTVQAEEKAAPAAAATEQVDDDERRVQAIIDRIYPAMKEPEPYKDKPVSPWMYAAVALPALFGAPDVSASVARGISGGRAARSVEGRERYEKERAAYEKRAEQRGGAILPYVTAKAGERGRLKLSEARLDLDRRRETFNQTLRSAQFVFEQFKFGNLSANQAAQNRLRGIDQQIRGAHNRATEALASGRLDEYARHNKAIETLTAQAREIARQHVEIARQRLAQGKAGDPTDVIRLYQFAGEQVTDLQAELSYATDAGQAAAVQKDLDYYRSLLQQLRPQIEKIGGVSPWAAGGGITKPAPTKRASDIHERWKQSGQALPTQYRAQLSQAEMDWLLSQGVEVK